MNANSPSARLPGLRARPAVVLLALLACAPAHASLFAGETLDAVANGVAWLALVVAPIVGITAFWLVHILPEKIAADRKHPQATAIHTLCILSLFFGGLLWPLAWLWAYSKPVLYKLAYGTDVAEDAHGKDAPAAPPAASPASGKTVPVSAQLAALEAEAANKAREEELQRLRIELSDLRRQLGGRDDARTGA